MNDVLCHACLKPIQVGSKYYEIPLTTCGYGKVSHEDTKWHWKCAHKSGLHPMESGETEQTHWGSWELGFLGERP